MSKFFGPIVQQGYVVPDIHLGIRHWLKRGIGPFFLEKLQNYPAEVDGHSVLVNLSAAFAYSGDQQIEVIQAYDNTNTMYGEYLERNPQGGLQHLGFWTNNISDQITKLEEFESGFLVRQRYGDRHVYLDEVACPGVMIQLMARDEKTEQLFRIVQEGAENWDGASHPIREIDWSSGWPVSA